MGKAKKDLREGRLETVEARGQCKSEPEWWQWKWKIESVWLRHLEGIGFGESEKKPEIRSHEEGGGSGERSHSGRAGSQVD